jgi:hypothetical protein
MGQFYTGVLKTTDNADIDELGWIASQTGVQALAGDLKRSRLKPGLLS